MVESSLFVIFKVEFRMVHDAQAILSQFSLFSSCQMLSVTKSVRYRLHSYRNATEIDNAIHVIAFEGEL